MLFINIFLEFSRKTSGRGVNEESVRSFIKSAKNIDLLAQGLLLFLHHDMRKLDMLNESETFLVKSYVEKCCQLLSSDH